MFILAPARVSARQHFGARPPLCVQQPLFGVVLALADDIRRRPRASSRLLVVLLADDETLPVNGAVQVALCGRAVAGRGARHRQHLGEPVRAQRGQAGYFDRRRLLGR
jgi:hypothetical protein